MNAGVQQPDSPLNNNKDAQQHRHLA